MCFQSWDLIYIYEDEVKFNTSNNNMTFKIYKLADKSKIFCDIINISLKCLRYSKIIAVL